MTKAIFYKEWLKTRFYLPAAAAVLMGFTAYSLLRIARVAELKGAAHVWEVMLSRDALFIDLMEYVPLAAGILLALVQFMPEMHRKCLKLTLHLPMPHLRAVTLMLAFGMAALAAIFAVCGLTIYGCLHSMLAPELCARILLSAMPWFLAGAAGYLLAGWICLEPTWRRRAVNIVVAAPLLRLYFLAPAPQAYDGFLPVLTLYTLLLVTLSWLSAARFREGRQD